MSEIEDLKTEVAQLKRVLADTRQQAIVAHAASGIMARIMSWMDDGLRGQLESGLDQIADAFMKDGLHELSTALFEFSAQHVRKRPK